MSKNFAFQISREDILAAIPQFTLSADIVSFCLQKLNHAAIEKAALQADDLDEQTTLAHAEINRQFYEPVGTMLALYGQSMDYSIIIHEKLYGDEKITHVFRVDPTLKLAVESILAASLNTSVSVLPLARSLCNHGILELISSTEQP